MKGFANFLLGCIFGGLIGAGAALLLTPSNGEEIRRQLQEKADEIILEFDQASKERKDELEADLANRRGTVR